MDEVKEALGGLHLDARPFSPAQAYSTAHLRPATRAQGLFLSVRACLALAANSRRAH